MSLRITVNGEQQNIHENSSLKDLLQILEVKGRLAIDVNGEIIPRSCYAEYFLAEGDRIEIVHAIGGG